MVRPGYSDSMRWCCAVEQSDLVVDHNIGPVRFWKRLHKRKVSYSVCIDAAVVASNDNIGNSKSVSSLYIFFSNDYLYDSTE